MEAYGPKQAIGRVRMRAAWWMWLHQTRVMGLFSLTSWPRKGSVCQGARLRGRRCRVPFSLLPDWLLLSERWKGRWDSIRRRMPRGGISLACRRSQPVSGSVAQLRVSTCHRHHVWGWRVTAREGGHKKFGKVVYLHEET